MFGCLCTNLTLRELERDRPDSPATRADWRQPGGHKRRPAQGRGYKWVRGLNRVREAANMGLTGGRRGDTMGWSLPFVPPTGGGPEMRKMLHITSMRTAELQGVPKKAAIKFLDFGPFLVFWTTPEAQIKKKIKAVPFNLIQDQ